MKYNKIFFYNHSSNDDIHVSREYIKYIIQNIKGIKKYIYVHGNSSKLLKDIKLLEFDNTLLKSLRKDDKYIFDQQNNALFINTWYGASPQYNRLGRTLNTLHHLFENIMIDCFNTKLDKNINYFLPKIDFSYYDIANIQNFMKKYSNIRKVFISNNTVSSDKSFDFDFNPIISYLSDHFPNILFLLSNKTDFIFKKHNIFYTSDIINLNTDNLNKISYISTFCDLIIGRASGPYIFSYIQNNLGDPKKTFICISNNQNEAFWILPYYNYCKAKIIWEEFTDPYDVIETIYYELEKPPLSLINEQNSYK